jgi:hypothetical protein
MMARARPAVEPVLPLGTGAGIHDAGVSHGLPDPTPIGWAVPAVCDPLHALTYPAPGCRQATP